MNATRSVLVALGALTVFVIAACSRDPGTESKPGVAGSVTAFVREANVGVARAADLSGAPSFADSKRGFIAAPEVRSWTLTAK